MVITWLPVWVQVGPSLNKYPELVRVVSQVLYLAGVLYTLVWLLWCVKVWAHDPCKRPDLGV